MRSFLFLLLFSFTIAFAQQEKVKPYGSVPSNQHMDWHRMEYYAFIHFTVNTFTSREWGEGTESAREFNPTALDCRQWARTAREAGMKGIIITAKHHDGFCLWPSKYSDHTVRESGWKNGKGDILKELSDACREFGLKFGVYVSPWDRNHPTYGTDKYNDTFINTLTEVLSNYGDIFEVWFDGANGEGPNGKKQVYDWKRIFETVRKLQPNALIFGPVGSDIRWVGNEEGYANETNWGTMNKDMTESDAGLKLLNTGLEGGDTWRPSEVDVSIRPGWFYHKNQDSKVKSLNKLVDIYFASVGRGSNLLLNVPPDQRGLFHENDVKALKELKKYLDSSFKTNLACGAIASASNVRENSGRFSPSNTVDNNPETYWGTDEGVTTASIELKLKKKSKINCVELKEYIPLGQRVKLFSVEAFINGTWKETARSTTIGYKKLVRFPEVNTDRIKINILQSKANPLIENIAAYKIVELEEPPVIKRNKKGMVTIKTDSPHSVIRYTTDGSNPSGKSMLYTAPFEMKNSGIVKSASFSGNKNVRPSIVTAEFGPSKENWSIVSASDEHKELPARLAIDDDTETFWHTHWSREYKKHPHEIIIDFGSNLSFSGFTFLPRQDGNNSGNITGYTLFISSDNSNWECVIKEGRFGNIANNPILQTVPFGRTVSARYIKMVTSGDANNNGWVNAAEIGIITK